MKAQYEARIENILASSEPSNTKKS
jgi:hypothetical protein